ncbi:hypothetical protein PC116_g11432 [Phytophthora cactorum]|uniref:Uncharacterized protein n=1 Tax=Phytophthora cactorum TaxID=29920 RepID=A0A8T1KUE4_9STRA|nr:hypothetical protein PC114_g25236 [Phytophthora cactorum]KAG2885958.1 hypothetical protein PC117_g25473 [Phytophthora cactorum]KAG2961893.1 hypothetical protein PC119_g25974 [Phytophthora cactorum]KAG3133766.1 hypothetical protein PC128_g26297 [Phytophthora cactorum]KAG4240644.1 hypothetical protein PC116_g11432 [Phytophthora cactorum]
MPSLATVQRFVQHYRHAHLGGSDFYDDITIWHADKAQGNAIDLVLGVDNELVNLMCYYRMAAKIY